MRQFTGNLSPCSFCMTSFNKTHLCPVFLQMAILELRAVSPDDPLHFTCFLCQFVAADRAQLKKHLTTLHQFPCHDWTPARDSLEDQMTCAHCGSVHHCQQALRKHIIYGHCSQFDPTRPWTRNGDADIVEQLSVGRIDLILANVEMKRRLTNDCQFCSQKFSLKCPTWWVICGNSTVNWLMRASAIDRSSSKDLLLEAAIVCHESNKFDPLIRVFSFIN